MKTTPAYAAANNPQKTLFTDLPDNQHDLERMQSETVIMDLPEVKDIPGQEHIRVMPLGEMADTTISSADEEGAGILDFDSDDTDGDGGISTVAIDAGEDEDFEDEDLEDEDNDADILADDDIDEDMDEDVIEDDDVTEFDDDDAGDEDDDITAGTSLAGSFDETSKEDIEAREAEITEDDLRLIENSGPVERDSDTDSLNRSRLDNTDFDGELLNEGSSTKSAAGSDLDVPGAELDDTDEALGEEDEENSVYSMADAD